MDLAILEFKIVNYSSNEIVDIILVLDRFNYRRTKKLHYNRYRCPNAIQIKKILLREHTRIRRRNRKNTEQDIDPLLLAVLEMLNF